MALHQTKHRGRRRALRFAPQAYETYQQTVGSKEPESYALLAGDRARDPFRIIDVRYCPPRRRPGGGFDASGSHLNIDDEYLNFVIDEEWRPMGLDAIGIIHSHPGDFTSLSIGDPASNTGDIAFFSTCLANDDSPNRDWKYFLAPIVTFGPDGSDHITGWMLRRGSTTPLPCDVIVEREDHNPGLAVSVSDLSAAIARDLLRYYNPRIGPPCQDPHLEHQRRQLSLQQLRDCAPGHFVIAKIIDPGECQP